MTIILAKSRNEKFHKLRTATLGVYEQKKEISCIDGESRHENDLRIFTATFVATTLHVTFPRIPVVSGEEDTTRKTEGYHPQNEKTPPTHIFRLFGERFCEISFWFVLKFFLFAALYSSESGIVEFLYVGCPKITKCLFTDRFLYTFAKDIILLRTSFII